MAHPLLGADIATLARAFRDGGGADRWLTVLGIWAGAMARQPASALERALLARRLPARGAMPPPIFIVGHWRSGTTHLLNLMSRAGFGYVPPLAAGLPWDIFGLAQILRPLLERQLPEERYVDTLPVTPTSPQEDEIALANMSPLSFYHGLYFPRAFDRLIDRGVFLDDCSPDEIEAWQERFDYLLRKLWLLQGRRLVIKNPVYTARPAMLRRMYPGAKFIHIHRDPYEVFLSMRNFYNRLLGVMALQDIPPDLDIDSTILRVYRRMMERFEAETTGWEAPEFAEIAYDRLDHEPEATLRQIYDSLELEGFAAALPAFRAHLDAVRDHRRNRFPDDAAARARVAGTLGRWIGKWGYESPAAAHDIMGAAP